MATRHLTRYEEEILRAYGGGAEVKAIAKAKQVDETALLRELSALCGMRRNVAKHAARDGRIDVPDTAAATVLVAERPPAAPAAPAPLRPEIVHALADQRAAWYEEDDRHDTPPTLAAAATGATPEPGALEVAADAPTLVVAAEPPPTTPADPRPWDLPAIRARHAKAALEPEPEQVLEEWGAWRCDLCRWVGVDGHPDNDLHLLAPVTVRVLAGAR